VPFNNTNKIITIPALGNDTDLRKLFFQPAYTIEPNTVGDILNRLTGFMNMLTRTPDVAFGFQDKQIRNEAAANLLGQSLIRNSSFLVTMFEFTFMNSFANDVLTCLYKFYDEFGGLSFAQDGEVIAVDREDLKAIQSIHVENGSMLESSQTTRLGKAAQLLNLIINPATTGIMKHKEIIEELVDAIGIDGWQRFLMTAPEIIQAMQMRAQMPEVIQGG